MELWTCIVSLFLVRKLWLISYQTLLGLRFEKIKNPEVWHEEVLAYEVYDKATNEFVGLFYMDMFPREGKFSHAAAFPLQEGCFTADGEWQVCFLCL